MELIALQGSSLNITVYRGYAKARDLAKISEPDVFDQISNPLGTQRNLKPWHAYEAHQYAAGQVQNRPKRLWPEIILNARDISVVDIGKKNEHAIVKIEVKEEKLQKSNGKNPQISRVDGNHRLFHAEGGGHRKLDPLDVEVPFCLVIGLNREEEASLFRDINANQEGMNTSHLDHLAFRLSPSEALKVGETALWISEGLSTDDQSPFYDAVYKGGKKSKSAIYRISLRSLKTGIAIILEKSTELKSEEIPYEKKYRAIRNFWQAVKMVFNEEWTNPKDYLLLKPSPGLFAMSEVAAIVIDRSFTKESPTVEWMKETLEPIKNKINWKSAGGTFAGYGGRGGAKKAANAIIGYLPKEYKLEKALEQL